jgi:hypothetical protein
VYSTGVARVHSPRLAETCAHAIRLLCRPQGRPGGTRRFPVGGPLHDALNLAFDAAEAAGLHVAFLVNSYPERTAANLRADIAWLAGQWKGRAGLYRDEARGRR